MKGPYIAGIQLYQQLHIQTQAQRHTQTNTLSLSHSPRKNILTEKGRQAGVLSTGLCPAISQVSTESRRAPEQQCTTL